MIQSGLPAGVKGFTKNKKQIAGKRKSEVCSDGSKPSAPARKLFSQGGEAFWSWCILSCFWYMKWCFYRFAWYYIWFHSDSSDVVITGDKDMFWMQDMLKWSNKGYYTCSLKQYIWPGIE